MSEASRLKMVALLRELATAEGMRNTTLDGVKIARADRSYPRTPVLYEPSIVILASGRKQGTLGERTFIYDAENYLILSVPLAFEVETSAIADEPVLGVSIRVDIATLKELAVKLGKNQGRNQGRGLLAADQKSVLAAPLDDSLGQATIRLLESLRTPAEASVLGPGIVREILYRVLSGEQGGMLWALLGKQGQLAQIHAALQRLHGQYAKALDVPRMAADAGMSVSAFHHNFKAVVGTSPVQYLKTLRLHKARMLILQDGVGAATAADRVGYESPSQFSREFKRFFGRTPMRTLDELKETLGYVSLGSASVG